MIKAFINNVSYMKIVKCWLFGFLFFIPFQRNIQRIAHEWKGLAGSIIGHVDEFTISVMFPIAIFELIRQKKITSLPVVIIMIHLCVLGLAGLVSGMINYNSLFITIKV